MRQGPRSNACRSYGGRVCTSVAERSSQAPSRPIHCQGVALTEAGKELLLVALEDPAKEFCTGEIGIARGLVDRGWAKPTQSKTWRLTNAGVEAALSLLKEV